MGRLFKAVLAAVVVLLIAILPITRDDYLAGLLSLFPLFALLTHYVVASERGPEALRTAIIFAM